METGLKAAYKQDYATYHFWTSGYDNRYPQVVYSGRSFMHRETGYVVTPGVTGFKIRNIVSPSYFLIPYSLCKMKVLI